MRSSAPRGSDSARWMPSASSRVRVAARRHAVSVTASVTRTLGSTSLVRPKSRRIGEALTPRLSTHAMRCGSTQPCTDGAMTARPCLLPAPSGRPAGVVRPFERASSGTMPPSNPQAADYGHALRFRSELPVDGSEPSVGGGADDGVILLRASPATAPKHGLSPWRSSANVRGKERQHQFEGFRDSCVLQTGWWARWRKSVREYIEHVIEALHAHQAMLDPLALEHGRHPLGHLEWHIDVAITVKQQRRGIPGRYEAFWSVGFEFL